MKRFVYADNAATTKMSEHVFNEMLPFVRENYGNPSSIYSLGSKSREVVEKARETIAGCFNAGAKEIYFTSGGSESDNWAIKGIANKLKKRGKNHIITSKFEHHAVLHTVQALAKEGFDVTYLDVYGDGIVRVEDLQRAITPQTAIVSIMYANNEIGTIQPIKELGAVCRAQGVIFHTDAVQAVGNVHIDVEDQNIDMMSLTAHKIHGPKGCGALYIRKGIRPINLIDGGAQEFLRRAGTENVSGIVGLSVAVKDATSTVDRRVKYLTGLRNRFIDGALKIEESMLNGDRHRRLPGNINMCFRGIEGESLLLSLDYQGICASSGSACTSGSLDPSHVLLAIGLPHETAHGSLRLSLSDENTQQDIDYILETLEPIVKRLRSMSPLWERIKKGREPE